MSKDITQLMLAQEKIRQHLDSGERDRLNKRIAFAAMELMNGNMSVLHNSEIFRNLHVFVDCLMESLKESDCSQIVLLLGHALTSHEVLERERGLVLLSLIVQRSYKRINKGELEVAMAELCRWIKQERVLLPGYEHVSQQMREIATMLFLSGSSKAMIAYLQALNSIIRNGGSESCSLRAIAIRNLKAVSSERNFQYLIDVITEHRTGEMSGEDVLCEFGNEAVWWMIDHLSNTSDDSLRLKLTGALIRIGDCFIDAVMAYPIDSAEKELAFDLIKILLSQSKDIPDSVIWKFASHADPSVQRKSINLMIMDKAQAHRRLLEGCRLLNGSVQADLIRLLVNMEGNKLSRQTGTLLLDIVKKSLVSDEPLDFNLLAVVVAALRAYPGAVTIDTLWSLHTSERVTSSKSLSRQLARTIRDLDCQMWQTGHRVNKAEDITFSDDPETNRLIRGQLVDFSDEVDALLIQGEKEKALKMLADKAAYFAAEKEFLHAEYLCARLTETDPRSVNTLFALEALIEREKRNPVPASFAAQWKNIRELLGKAAFIELYDRFVVESYSPGEALVRTGDRSHRLYFIHSGSVVIHCQTPSGERFIRRYREGNVFGADVVFDISYWTISISAETDTKVYTISREDIQKLDVRYTGLWSNLKKCCVGDNFSEQIVVPSGEERRQERRVEVDAELSVWLYDRFGRIGLKAIRARMVNFSENGLCYTLRVAKREKTFLMLGRDAEARMTTESGRTLCLLGEVVAVRQHDEDAGIFRIHVSLHSELDSAQAYELNSLSRKRVSSFSESTEHV